MRIQMHPNVNTCNSLWGKLSTFISRERGGEERKRARERERERENEQRQKSEAC